MITWLPWMTVGVPLEDTKIKSLKIAFFIQFSGPITVFAPLAFKSFTSAAAHRCQYAQGQSPEIAPPRSDPDIRPGRIFLVCFQRINDPWFAGSWS